MGLTHGGTDNARESGVVGFVDAGLLWGYQKSSVSADAQMYSRKEKPSSRIKIVSPVQEMIKEIILCST